MGEGHALIKLKRRKVPVCNLHVTAVATGQSQRFTTAQVFLFPSGRDFKCRNGDEDAAY